MFTMSRDDALAHASRSGSGHLTTVVDGRMESVVIPFVIEEDDTSLTVLGHLSAANRQVTSINERSEVLLIVDGPIAYVSPSLYPTKAESGKVVPTLNYVSVQIRGHLQPVTDPDAFRRLLGAITSRFESSRDHPWSINDAPDEFIESQMKAIRGFSMRIDDIQGVAKHSQNRPKSDQIGVRESFSFGADDERIIASRMD